MRGSIGFRFGESGGVSKESVGRRESGVSRGVGVLRPVARRRRLATPEPTVDLDCLRCSDAGRSGLRCDFVGVLGDDDEDEDDP